MTPLEKVQREQQLVQARENFEHGLNLYAFFKIGNRTLCKDLVQDTFIKAWIYISKGKQVRQMKAFLYHILNDLVVDQYRKIRAVSLDALMEKGFEPIKNDSHALLNFLNELDAKAAVLLVDKLPACYKKIIEMRFLDELTLKEIAIITGDSINNIAVKLHRGLEKLKSLYFSSDDQFLKNS